MHTITFRKDNEIKILKRSKILFLKKLVKVFIIEYVIISLS